MKKPILKQTDIKFKIPAFIFINIAFIFVFIFPGYKLNFNKSVVTSPLVATAVTITPTSFPTTPVPTEIIESVQTISYVADQAIENSTRVLNFMTWILGIFLTISLAVIGPLLANLKQTTDNLQEVRRNYQTIADNLEKTNIILGALSDQYWGLQQNYYGISKRTIPPELAVKAYSLGRISQDEYFESQIWFSWQKWISAGDLTGYEELLVHAEADYGLPDSVLRSVISKLGDLEKKKKIGENLTTTEREIRIKLKRLLDMGLKYDSDTVPKI